MAEQYFRPLKNGLFIAINGKPVPKAEYIRGTEEDPGGWLPSDKFAQSDHIQGMHLDVNLFPHGKNPVVFDDAVKELLDGKQLTMEWMKEMNAKHRQRFYDGHDEEMTCGFEPLSIEKLVNYMNTFHPGWQKHQTPTTFREMNRQKIHSTNLQKRNEKRTFAAHDGTKTWKEMKDRYQRGSFLSQKQNLQEAMNTSKITPNREPEAFSFQERPIVEEGIVDESLFYPQVKRRKTPSLPYFQVKRRKTPKPYPRPIINVNVKTPKIDFNPALNINPAPININPAPININPAPINIALPSINTILGANNDNERPPPSASVREAVVAAVVNEEVMDIQNQALDDSFQLAKQRENGLKADIEKLKLEKTKLIFELDQQKEELASQKRISDAELKVKEQAIVQLKDAKLKEIETSVQLALEAQKIVAPAPVPDAEIEDLRSKLKLEKEKNAKEIEDMDKTHRAAIKTIEDEMEVLKAEKRKTSLTSDDEINKLTRKITSLGTDIELLKVEHTQALKAKEEFFDIEKKALQAQMVTEVNQQWEVAKTSLVALKNKELEAVRVEHHLQFEELKNQAQTAIQDKQAQLVQLDNMGVELEGKYRQVVQQNVTLEAQVVQEKNTLLAGFQKTLKNAQLVVRQTEDLTEKKVNAVLEIQKHYPEIIKTHLDKLFGKINQNILNAMRENPERFRIDLLPQYLGTYQTESDRLIYMNHAFNSLNIDDFPSLTEKDLEATKPLFAQIFESAIQAQMMNTARIYTEGVARLGFEESKMQLEQANEKVVNFQQQLEEIREEANQMRKQVVQVSKDGEDYKTLTAQISPVTIENMYGEKIDSFLAGLNDQSWDMLVAGTPRSRLLTLGRIPTSSVFTNWITIENDLFEFLRNSNQALKIPDATIKKIIGMNKNNIGAYRDALVQSKLTPLVEEHKKKKHAEQLHYIEEEAKLKTIEVERKALVENKKLEDDLYVANTLLNAAEVAYQETGEVLRSIQTGQPIETEVPKISLPASFKKNKPIRVEGIDEQSGRRINPTQRQYNEQLLDEGVSAATDILRSSRKRAREDKPNTRNVRSRSVSLDRPTSTVTKKDKAVYFRDGRKKESEKKIDEYDREELEELYNKVQASISENKRAFPDKKLKPVDALILGQTKKAIQEQIQEFHSAGLPVEEIGD
jgi:hypothetical protein